VHIQLGTNSDIFGSEVIRSASALIKIGGFSIPYMVLEIRLVLQLIAEIQEVLGLNADNVQG
jgi:hypothetical protein